MTGQDRDGEKVLHITGRGDGDEELRYEIALVSNGDEVKERVLARAASGQLAHAIFHAAKSEHPDARIILRRDARLLVDSSTK
jgi:hypothetical protein